ncbi:hypothetical protein EON62_01960 [archaeon]|nr:MAG: hypothetical protein EON62_01960 [archaeon]
MQGSSATTYRWMRRTEILAEARRATAAISAPVIVRSPQGLPPVAPPAGMTPASAAPLLRIDSNATAASGLPSVGGAPARIKQKGAVTSLLQSRDLRVVDSAFEIGSEPAILVRKHCIVVNLPPGTCPSFRSGAPSLPLV